MEELGVVDSISDSWSWPFVFCSLTDTLFCTIWQKDPAVTAAFDHRVHLTSSVILAASQSYCWCSWGNEHPVKNGAENASAFLHLSVSGQERSLLMTSSFKGSWQANVAWPRQSCSSVHGNNLGSVTHSHFVTDVCSFALPARAPSTSTRFQTQLCQGWRAAFSLSLSLSSTLLSPATGVIYNTVHRKHNISGLFFSFRCLIKVEQCLI